MVGATIDPLRAVQAGRPADALVAKEDQRSGPQQRKARKAKPPALGLGGRNKPLRVVW